MKPSEKIIKAVRRKIGGSPDMDDQIDAMLTAILNHLDQEDASRREWEKRVVECFRYPGSTMQERP